MSDNQNQSNNAGGGNAPDVQNQPTTQPETETQHPAHSQITKAHFDEWVNCSGVSSLITQFSISSLSDPRDIDRLLSRNTNKRWKHWEHGPGWSVYGVDPETGERVFDGAQFKPDTPVHRYENGQPKFKRDGSPDFQKYFSASDYETVPLFLNTGIPDYWLDVMTDITKRLLITEGPKKAGAGLTAGEATISLPGVTNGQKLGRLKKALLKFCTVGRVVGLAFDADMLSNPSVCKALDKMGRLLIAEGCVVKVLILPKETKGMDDYIVAHGHEAFRQLVDDALTFEEWREEYFLRPKREAAAAGQSYGTWADHVCEQLGVNPSNYVGLGTFDSYLFNRDFQQGQGDWRVIDLSFHRYTRQGHWKALPEPDIHALIARRAMEVFQLKQDKYGDKSVSYPYGNNSHSESAFKYNRKALHVSDPPANKHLLCFQNCTVDLRTGQPMPHDPDHFLTSAIASDYIQGAECPEDFRSFIIQAFGSDMIDRIRAWTSWVVDPTAPSGYFPHIMGPSGSGKGTLLRLWSKMFISGGSKAISSFEDLAKAEGRHQILTGARFVYFPDVKGFIQGLNAFYELVDDGQMSGRTLFSPVTYSKNWGVKFAMASVDHVVVENMGDGWNRRVRYLPTRSLGAIPIESRKTLENRLESCLGEIIGWALSMPRAERDRLVMEEETDERLQVIRTDAATYGDPIKSFVDLSLRPTASSAKVSTAQLHTWYTHFCSAHGYQPAGMTKFASHLKTILSQCYVERRRSLAIEGERRMIPACWTNIVPLDGVYRQIGENNDPDDPFIKCLKLKCEEGGLFEFAEFFNSPDSGPGGSNGGGGGHTSPSGGSGGGDQIGSAGSPTPTICLQVADPQKTTSIQAFQDLDHLDHLDHLPPARIEKNQMNCSSATLPQLELSQAVINGGGNEPDPAVPSQSSLPLATQNVLTQAPDPAQHTYIDSSDTNPPKPTEQELAGLLLLCQTWVAVAEVVNQDGDKLKQAACRVMTKEQRQGLTTMLATHLCENPSDLNKLKWVPVKLLSRALERLTFTIRRVGGANILDASLEFINGCKFVSVSHLGDRYEQWVFSTPEGNRIPVFGTDAIEALALS